MLDDLRIASNSNLKLNESGLDSYKDCRDREFFIRYPHRVEYHYNSRGFRDSEWPENPRQAVWCVGDSFTVGLGAPLDRTWPYLLKQKLNKPGITIAMDGGSNEWICRRVNDITQQAEPALFVIMWSYANRREIPNSPLPDDRRRVWATPDSDEQDFYNWLRCFRQIKALGVPALHFAIPNAHAIFDVEKRIVDLWQNVRAPSWPIDAPTSIEHFEQFDHSIKMDFLKNNKDAVKDLFKLFHLKSLKQQYLTELSEVVLVPQLDYSRDCHHFDVLTATWVVDQAVGKLAETNTDLL